MNSRPSKVLGWFGQAANEYLYRFEPSQLSDDVLILFSAAEKKFFQPRSTTQPDPFDTWLGLLPAHHLSKWQRGEICVKKAYVRTRFVYESTSPPPTGYYDCEREIKLAEDNLMRAICYFSDSLHRAATVKWMLGCHRLLQEKIELGLLDLGESIKLYEQTIRDRRINQNAEAANWYTLHIAQLQQKKKEIHKIVIS